MPRRAASTSKVVVMEKSPGIDTPLRDVATEIGEVHPDATVLVLSPGWAGTYSTSYDRVTLEAGRDVAKTSPNPGGGRTGLRRPIANADFPLDDIHDRARAGGRRGDDFDAGAA